VATRTQILSICLLYKNGYFVGEVENVYARKSKNAGVVQRDYKGNIKNVNYI